MLILTLDKYKRLLRYSLGVLATFIVLILLIAIITTPQGNIGTQPDVPTEQSSNKPQELADMDEMSLQRQLQDILETGEESGCANLSDERYRLACLEFLKIQQ